MPIQSVKNPLALVAIAAVMMGVICAILGSLLWVIVLSAQGKPILPRVRRAAVPWGIGSILAILGLYLGLQLVAIAVFMLVRTVAMPGAGMPPTRDLLLVNLLLQVAIVVAIPTLLRLTSRARTSDLGLRPEDWPWNLARGAVTCLLMLPLVYSTAFLAQRVWKPHEHPVQTALGQDLGPGTILVTVLVAVVAAPLCEEMLFRGVLLGWLWKVASRVRPKPPISPADRLVLFLDDVGHVEVQPEPVPTAPALTTPFRPLPDWGANVVVSAIFAGLHYAQWPAPIPLFVLSLALGELYRRTGSLVAPIALHASFNGLSALMMILMSASGAKLPG